MTLDELKSEWQQPYDQKSNAEVEQIISNKASSVFFRTKLKVIIETVAFTALILIFMTGLDSERNETWVNALLIVVVILGIANNLWLYRGLSATIPNLDLRTSLFRHKKRLQGQIIFSVVFSSMFFGSVFLFFFFRTPFTSEKIGLLVALLIVSIGIRTVVEVGRWLKHIRQLDEYLFQLAH
ncbi:MAG: hypothetical protein ACFB15_25340 [Cyclobacteriaceae bacterium]